MNRFVTFYSVETDKIGVLTEKEYDEDSSIVDFADEYVWQFAENKEKAIQQHFAKLDKWEADPTKETY